MTASAPTADVDKRFSDPKATPMPWPDVRDRLAKAELYWLSTVRPDGRPHVTPLIAVWLDEALYFCTGPDERKNKNLERNPHCILTTGCNTLGEGIDLVVEGDAVRLTEDTKLKRLADDYVAKYGDDWKFDVSDGAFHHHEGAAVVYEVKPAKAFAFTRGEAGGQTRWRF